MQTGAAAQVAGMDVLMPGMAQITGGQIEFDPQRMMDLASGKADIGQVLRRGGEMSRRLGPRGMQEMLGKRQEFMDEMQQRMGGQMQAMMPHMVMRAIMKQAPGITAFGAATMVTGGDEKAARYLQQQSQDPNFWRDMQQQMDVQRREQRQDIARARTVVRERAEDSRIYEAIGPGRIRDVANEASRARRQMSRMGERVADIIAERQDYQEMEAAEGGELVRRVRRARFMGGGTQARVRDTIRQRQARGEEIGLGAAGEEIPEEEGTVFERFGETIGLRGAEGWGITAAQRGGVTRRQMVLKNVGLIRAWRHRLSGADRVGALDLAATERSQIRMGRMAEVARTDSNKVKDRAYEAARKVVRSGQMDEKQFEQITNDAAGALNDYLQGTRSWLGPTFDDEPTEGDMKKALKDALSKRGYTAAQIENALQESFIQNALIKGEGTRESGAAATLEELEREGGQAATRKRLDRVSKIRESGDAEREALFEKIGLDLQGQGEWTYDIGEEAATRLINVAAGTGPGREKEDELRRLRISKRALGAFAVKSGSEEAKRQQRRTSSQIRKLEKEVGGDAARRARAGAEQVNLGADALFQMGEKLAGMSTDEASGMLKRVGERSIGIAREITLAAGYEALLGEGVSLVGEQGAADFERLQGWIEGGERGVGKDVAALIEQAAAGSPQATQKLQRLAQREGAAVMGERGAGRGLTQVRGEGEGAMEGVRRGLQEFFGADRERTQQAVSGAGGGDFGQAVTTFSEASSELMMAAKAFQTEKDTNLITKAVRTAVPFGYLTDWLD